MNGNITRPLIRFTALLCAAVLLCSAVLLDTAVAPVTVRAESAEELRDQKEEILAKQKELEAKRNEFAASLKEQEAEKAVLQDQIDLKIEEIEVNQKLIDAMDDKIEEKNYQIALKQQAIAEKEAELETRFEELRTRLRALSKIGSIASTLQMLMSADGFTDYLVKNKAMQRISEENELLMAQLEAEMQAINADKALLEQDKAALEEERKPIVEVQTALNLSKQELDVLYSEINAVTEKLNADIDHYNAAIDEAEADAAALQDKINELIRENIGSGQAYISGTMYWPGPSCNIISSRFKYRWGRWHRGIDICGSGCYGTPVVAGTDGVVSYSGWMSGYGWCVMIDHGRDSAGNNITTMYAHCSSLYVSVGQAVSGGQSIAAVGSSGNSTGPHIHFEVRVNGTAVDPIANGYLSTSGIIINESL